MDAYKDIKYWYFLPTLLFIIFHILSLYSANVDFVKLENVVKSFLIILVLSLIINIILVLILKEKGFLLSTLFIIFLLVYGHIKPYFEKYIGSNLFPYLWIISLILCSAFIILKLKNINNLIKALIFVFSLIIITPTITIVKYYVLKPDQELKNTRKNSEINKKFLKNNNTTPDIYYIILDGYARGDVLKDIFKYDNSSFLDKLEEKGFYIADKSSANYGHTTSSLASSLNMNYMDKLIKNLDTHSTSRTISANLLIDSEVRKFFSRKDYKYVTVSSGYTHTDIQDSDKYYKVKEKFSRFELLVFSISFLNEFPPTILGKNNPYTIHAKRILFSFTALPEIAKDNDATFTMFHIISPHPPFIFKEDGTLDKTEQKLPFRFGDADHYREKRGRQVNSAEYQKRYIRQLIFLNKKILESVNKIISNSKTPPIIVIQGDHGPGSLYCHNKYNVETIKERLSILNAYYFPNKGKSLLYNSISPVNTFRVIVNYYFNQDYRILEDKSYFASWKRPYLYKEVPKSILK